MQRLKDDPPPPPDVTWFKRLVATAILYRSAERTVRAMKFPAYGAQIVAYLVAGLSYRTGGRIEFGRIWSSQGVSPQLEELVRTWAPQIDGALRASAGQRNPSEWYKKEDSWAELRSALPSLADPLPPELSFRDDGQSSGSPARSAEISLEDYNRIARCMEVSGPTWLEIAERGQRAGLIHWRVAGICRTLAGYAVGGWERKPSPKQAKPAIEALKSVEQAGLLANVTVQK